MKDIVFGTYNFEFGGLDGGDDTRLRRQLVMLDEVRADAWALGKFQECSGWQNDRTRTRALVETKLGMRGFFARSNRGPGGDVAVFIRESAGIRFVEPRHEERPQPYWHAVAHIVVHVEGYGYLRLASAHLAPASPQHRVAEAEAFQLIAEKHELGLLIAGGDWNGAPVGGPGPDTSGMHTGKARRKTDTQAAAALAEFMADVAVIAGDDEPTVGHWDNDGLAYRCDRLYTTLPAESVITYRVIKEERSESDHRPVAGTFRLG